MSRSHSEANSPDSSHRAAVIAGWGAVQGARRVPVAEVEQEFRLSAGKIGKGAGIESVAQAVRGEDESTLATHACGAALKSAGVTIADVDGLIATTETHSGFPSLAAVLHAKLHMKPEAAAIDVGGGCLGAVNALAVAYGLITSGGRHSILVATADVHSRILTPTRVGGEFGALFGDGASAFLVTSTADANGGYQLGDFLFGCDSSAAAAIRVGLNDRLNLDVVFEGAELSRAAVGRLHGLVLDLETKSGARHKDAVAFATHQPNPRLLAALAKKLHVALEKFPPVTKQFGNLGASTCGTALAFGLAEAARHSEGKRGPIFVAALGPGLLWGGTVLTPNNGKAHE